MGHVPCTDSIILNNFDVGHVVVYFIEKMILKSAVLSPIPSGLKIVFYKVSKFAGHHRFRRIIFEPIANTLYDKPSSVEPHKTIHSTVWHDKSTSSDIDSRN